jgi:integrase
VAAWVVVRTPLHAGRLGRWGIRLSCVLHSHKALSENTVNLALRRLGYAGVMTAHGFRATASTLLNGSGKWRPDVIERALAHKDTNAVRSVYNRSTYWEERVEMMAWWSDELDRLKAAVRR